MLEKNQGIFDLSLLATIYALSSEELIKVQLRPRLSDVHPDEKIWRLRGVAFAIVFLKPRG